MQKHKMSPGDLIVARDQSCLIYKETRAYYYYLMSGHSCRIKKQKLWYLIDTVGDIVVSYNSTKKRRPQKSMRTLDLHGLSRPAAQAKLEEFLAFVELPCKVITGNSKQMQSILFSSAESRGHSCRVESDYNLGAFIVFE